MYTCGFVLLFEMETSGPVSVDCGNNSSNNNNNNTDTGEAIHQSILIFKWK